MKDSLKHSPVMEFVFQTIKIEQVRDLIPHAYRSKYEAIREQVIEKIKTMPDGQTFMFQPQDRKVKLDDNLIARICHGINTGLVKEAMDWKINYSRKASAFVVAPFKRSKRAKRDELHLPKEEMDRTVTSVREIVPKPMPSDEEVNNIKVLLHATHTHFGKSLKDLQTRLIHYKTDSELSKTKKAFIYVARNAMGVRLSTISELLGMQVASIPTVCKRAKLDPNVIEYAKVLTEAISKNGGNN